jgi:hypothetical protein
MDDSVYIFDARLLVDDGIGCTVAVLVLWLSGVHWDGPLSTPSGAR